MLGRATESFEKNRGVSPVIGVILMVAITVILAAVIGTFVLDLGKNAGQSAPQASLDISADPNANGIVLEHMGGDALDSAETDVIIENKSSGDTIEWEHSEKSVTLTVGESTTLLTNASGIDGAWDNTQMTQVLGNQFDIQSGYSYEITIIDLDSQRQIHQTTVTA